MKVKVALAQLEPIPASPKSNLSRVIDVIKSYDADLYVYPELYLTGYTSKDLIPRHALRLDDPIIKELEKVVRREGVGAVVGFAELTDYGFLYNSALALGPSGVEHVFRKRHLPTFSVFDECRWFRPYRGSLSTWYLNDLGVGVGICYDIFFPEIFKSYALMGAKLLIVISASPDTSVPLFHVMARARALENTSYFVWVNMVGIFKGLGFGGSSMVADPLGGVEVKLKDFEEDIKVVTLDISKVYRARSVRPVIRDSYIEDAKQLLNSYEVFEGMKQ